MDTIDQMILKLLSQNSRLSATAISKAVHLSVPAVTERIKQLEMSGIIHQYTIKTNYKDLGYSLQAFIFVSIDETEHIHLFRQKIIAYPEVLECHHIAGAYDYLLKVVVEDTDALETFITHRLKAIKGVSQSNTIFNLSTLKHTFNREV